MLGPFFQMVLLSILMDYLDGLNQDKNKNDQIFIKSYYKIINKFKLMNNDLSLKYSFID